MAPSKALGFLGYGPAACRIREIDWQATALGGPEGWNDCVKSLIGTMTHSLQPMLLLLGPELVQVYNDAYIGHGLSRHPEQMGARTADTWPEVIDELSGPFAAVMDQGTAIQFEESLQQLVRDDRVVDVYFTYNCTPFMDAGGSILGILILAFETTQQVLQRARDGALAAFSAVLRQVDRADKLPGAAATALAAGACDRTVLRCCQTPATYFSPRSCDSSAAAVDAGRLAAIAAWMREDDGLWQRLRAGGDVHHEQDVLVPLGVKQATDVFRFVAFELDPLLPFDEPYRVYLHQVTERLAQAADRLEAASERASSANERQELLMHAPIATAVVTGSTLVFTLANEHFCRVVGKHDLIGRTYEDAFPELVGTPFPALLHGLFESGDSYESPEVEVLLDRDGSGVLETCYFRFTTHPMKTFDGEVHGLMTVAVDLTEQVRDRLDREAAHALHLAGLEATAERLEATVRERTVSLQALNGAMVDANEALAESRDEAQAANRAKSAFLANMSHEIRTPLNAILGLSHLLARRVVDPGQLDQISKVENAARHLLALISNVLDLSKIEADKLVLEDSEFIAADVIGWALDMVRTSALAKGLPMLNDTSSLPKYLRGDSRRLSQILINLLSNAIKFTDNGFIVLRASVTESRGGRQHLLFEIQDTGIGIDESMQHRLFGAFEQADTSTSRQHGGSGLGLALSRQLALAMGGDIGVESKVGVGSRFWFDVWLEEASASPDRDVSRHLESDREWRRVTALEADVRRLHAGRRVLVAEDNPVNLEVAVALLEEAGLTVDTARNGIEAIDKVKAGEFDLVLMDMQMPQLDGLEASRVIRAEMLALPIIAMTANAFVDDRHACLAAGMDDHLSKPVRPRVLYSMLLRWLADAPSAVD